MRKILFVLCAFLLITLSSCTIGGVSKGGYLLINDPSLDLSVSRHIVNNDSDFVNDSVKQAITKNTDKYNDQYFLHNSLIVFSILETSGSISHKISSHKIDNDTITINVKRTTPEWCTDDMMNWLVAYEVTKEELQNVNSIVIMVNGEELKDRVIEEHEDYLLTFQDENEYIIKKPTKTLFNSGEEIKILTHVFNNMELSMYINGEVYEDVIQNKVFYEGKYVYEFIFFMPNCSCVVSFKPSFGDDPIDFTFILNGPKTYHHVIETTEELLYSDLKSYIYAETTYVLDEEFFSNNSLVVFSLKEDSSSIRYELESVYEDGGVIYVKLNKNIPDIYTEDLQTPLVVLVVSKDRLNKARLVRVYCEDVELEEEYGENEQLLVEALKALGYHVTNIHHYYGKYGNSLVVLFNLLGGGAITQEKVADAVFLYPDTTTMMVYVNGEFTSLGKAYENGYLTYNDIKDIEAIHKGNMQYIYDAMGE